jgi:hypothetical protein
MNIKLQEKPQNSPWIAQMRTVEKTPAAFSAQPPQCRERRRTSEKTVSDFYFVANHFLLRF